MNTTQVGARCSIFVNFAEIMEANGKSLPGRMQGKGRKKRGSQRGEENRNYPVWKGAGVEDRIIDADLYTEKTPVSTLGMYETFLLLSRDLNRVF